MRAPVSRILRTLGVAGLLIAGSAAAPAGHGAGAQEMEVPVDVQLPILLKVITFDRRLAVRAPREVVVGVAYQAGNRASVVAKDAALRILRETASVTEGIGVRAVAVDLDHQTLASAHSAQHLTHLYVTPLRATDVGVLATWARAAGVTTMSGVKRHVEDGLALGVGLRGGRPRILVNVEASRLEGADLSAELLKLAEIVK